MKRTLVAGLVLTSFLALISACGDGGGTGPAPPPPPPPPPPPAPAVAAVVTVTPARVSFSSIGDTVHLTASVTDQYGQPFTATVAWRSDAPAVFTVDADGVVTSAGNGSGAVRASVGSVSATADVTVRQEAATILVEPSSISFSSLGDTAVATASATDANGHPVETAVTWESSAPEAFTVDTLGVITAVGNGQGSVRARVGARSGAADVTVRQEAATILVEPSAVSFSSLADTALMVASVEDANGHPVEDAPVTWESSAPEVFTVDTLGVVTSVGNGEGSVRATVDGRSDTAGVTVRQVASAVLIEPSSVRFFSLGETVVLEAHVTDANSHPVADASVTWESSAPLVVAVDTAGVATAVAPGRALITATSGLASSSVPAFVEFETHISVAVLDTTFVVPVAAGGGQWTFETEEARWLPELPVATVERRDSPPGLRVRVSGPGWVRTNVSLADGRAIGTSISVEPPEPFVLELRQDDWPRDDRVTARGYAVDRIPLPAFTVSGESAVEARGDSVETVFHLPPLNGGRCAGNPLGTGILAVHGIDVGGNTSVNRLAGPVVDLEVGESYRADGRQACLRLVAPRDAAYVLAGMERSTIEGTRNAPIRWRYDHDETYEIEVADRTSEPAADREVVAPAEPGADRDVPLFTPPKIRSAVYDAATEQGIDDATEAWVVGDRFEWGTADGRNGPYEVVGVYPPNLVLGVFEADKDVIWTPNKARDMNEVMERLSSERAQEVFRALYGPSSRPPVSNTENGQMVVMYARGGDNTSTGITTHSVMNNDRSTTAVHITDFDWTHLDWFNELTAHELGHAWHFANFPGFVGVWATEGLAHFVADEVGRAASGTPLDANLNPRRRWLGLTLNLPNDGNFLYGYNESSDYLRFLMNQLIGEGGLAYESAGHQAMAGFAEGYWGHYYTHFGAWSRRGKGPGLVGRMRAVIPGWEPADSRLDWMISYALDDRVELANYDIPFVSNAWRAFGPWTTLRLGSGRVGGGQAATGGQHYFMIEQSGRSAGSVLLRVTAGDAEMEWKLVRYR
ncbi:Ig-like domain-containing protein [Candidatus Palauibacter sp.]|uniref:Ig-like domain-containing protein n=1 Tax=Candidatus Palauibacter sp. TaxID=3101350 RepID=UPI003B01EF57